MRTFTSTLPEVVIKKLDDISRVLSVPKNKIIEKALNIYLDQLNRAEYIKSYKQANEDADIQTIAEEGMIDYLKQLEDEAM